MGKMNAQEERFGFREQGKFTCSSGISNPMLIALGILWLLGIVFAVTDNPTIVSIFGRWLDPAHSMQRLFATIPLLLAWTAFAAWGAVILLHGADYCYEADNEVFVIYRVQSKDRREVVDTFYYHDVLEVSYYDSLFHMGYIVEIRTPYRTARYRLVFTKMMTDRSTRGTPFYTLEQRAGLRGEDKEAAGWAP